MQPVFRVHELSVLPLGTASPDGFAMGLYEKRIGGTIVGYPPEDGRIRLRFSRTEKREVPVQFLHPIVVSLKGCKAIVIDGPLIGQVVKLKKVEGEMAEVQGPDNETCSVPTAILCKYKTP